MSQLAKENKIELLRLCREACLPENYVRASFKDFSGLKADDRKVVEIVRAWGAQRSGWVFLTGKSGVGKTHLMCATMKSMIEQGRECYFKSTIEYLEQMRDFKVRDEIRHTCTYRSVLFLDDLGMHSWNDKVLEEIYLLLNTRYNNQSQTMITSNMELAEMAQMEGLARPIAGRIKERTNQNLYLILKGQDRRLQNGKK